MKKIALCTLAVLAAAQPALAVDVKKSNKEVAVVKSAASEGNWMVRGRVLSVMPDEDSSMNIPTKVKLGNAVVPELDISYFFTPNVAVELIAAVTPHSVSTKSGVDAGEVWLLPPTLTLQYHFTQFEGFKPYVGAGVNYTHFFGADAGALNSPEYKDSIGGALQAGVDVPMGNNWYANVDVKKIFIDTTAKFNNGAIRAGVDIDPWIVGVGAGYRF